MPSPTTITVPQLLRLVGLPDTPTIIDVRSGEDYDANPRLLPASYRRDFDAVGRWASEFAACNVIVVCQKGQKLSQGVAAWLRHEGIRAESLEGGFEGWCDASGALVAGEKIPRRDDEGRTVWVTRSRPKVDRIACPWLIRRFVDPSAVFLFVDPSEVAAVADRFQAQAFDIDGVFWSHRGERCTFDAMIEEFGVRLAALDRLAMIVRAADTARLDLVPQAAGYLAAALGLSRMYRDDLEQLEAGMLLHDAFYRWCRDATEETHNWPSTGKVS